LVWQDKRLLQERISNNDRFLEAASQILAKLAKYVDPTIQERYLKNMKSVLCQDLKKVIRERDQSNVLKEGRIGRYKELSETNNYGGKLIESYDENKWFEEAVNENVRGIRDRSDIFLTRWDPITDIYTWKDPNIYKQSHWYRFQESVKQHQKETLDILMKTNLKGLELPEF
jgi:uncharacterized protein (UPF0305 family)